MFFVVILTPQLLYTSVMASEQAMSDQEKCDTETKPKVTLHVFHTTLWLLFFTVGKQRDQDKDSLLFFMSGHQYYYINLRYLER